MTTLWLVASQLFRAHPDAWSQDYQAPVRHQPLRLSASLATQLFSISLLAFCSQSFAQDKVYEFCAGDSLWMVTVPGRGRVFVEFSEKSNSDAVRSFGRLKYKILISRKLSTENSPISFWGTLGKEIPPEMAKPNTEGKPSRHEFILKGWFIKPPFIQFPEKPDIEGGTPIIRTNLRPDDFREMPPPSIKINFDKDGGFFWVGQKPKQ